MCDETINISDEILCTYLKYLNHKERKANEEFMLRQFSYCTIQDRDIDKESMFWLKQSENDCRVLTHKTRGGNAKSEICSTPNASGTKVPEVKAGYDNFTSKSLEEYLLIPCKMNTYRNYVSCDVGKCCSIRHQLFMNQTKKKI